MKNSDGAYFRQRGQFHLTMSAMAESGVACVHRLFAKLYFERAMRVDRHVEEASQKRRSIPSMRHPASNPKRSPVFVH